MSSRGTRHSTWIVILTLAAFAGCDGQDPLGLAPELRVTAATSLTASAIWYDRIDLAWQDNASNETGWEVHRSTTGSSGTFTLYSQYGPNTAAASYTGLAPSTEFCFKVRSVRVSGRRTTYGTFSNVACATTLVPPPPPPPPPPPNAPSETGAMPLGSTLVSVWWTDNSTNEDGFRVERSTDGGANWAVAATTTWGAINDAGRTSEQQVCYRVIAFNGNGDSPPSDTACTAPPAGPTNLTVTWITEQWFDVTWTDNSTVEDGYEVLLSDGEGYCGAVYSLPANSTSFTGPPPSCWYVVPQWYISVRATRDAGFSDSVVWP